ncbi:MAG: beta-lactamase family protein, partial [Saprospiraceae bacterium]|nr:beta-lactamase family protein [Saprospiraceae bacterium]
MINYSILFCCFLQLCSCKSDSSSLTKNDSTSHSVSDTYQAADFTEDSRRDQISRIADTLHRIMEDHAKEIHIPGLAYGLVVDNELVLASSTGQVNLEKEIPTTTTSSFRIASMTKSFTALAILKLRDEGALSLEDPVADYIPEMSSLVYLTQDAPVIDVENLLTMTAGFPEDNPWGDRQLDEPDQMLLDLLTDGVSFSNPTSHQFEYSNTGFALLGHIISRVSGIPYQDYITEQILQPLGMHHTYWEYDSVPLANLAIGYRWENDQWTLEPMLHDGAYGAMGGLITSIEDF